MTKFTKEEFIAWLRTKPAEEPYSYLNNWNCPIAQFLKAKGIAVHWVGGWTWQEKTEDGALVTHGMPEWLGCGGDDGFLVKDGWACEPMTFGALLERCEASLTAS